MQALARAKQRREERAVEAQSARLEADTARTLRNSERAKEHGMVEKSAGESSAGSLQKKWMTFLVMGEQTRDCRGHQELCDGDKTDGGVGQDLV